MEQKHKHRNLYTPPEEAEAPPRRNPLTHTPLHYGQALATPHDCVDGKRGEEEKNWQKKEIWRRETWPALRT